ncbi:MAG: DUF5702 domain-containing protein [Eubacterium sp.]|nr:DUF5702 domain-containing protein [Eubacterium sp.]
MKKGSITCYLCMILLVILSMIFAAYYSARQAAGRVVLASGLEQGLYSEFAQYDRELFDKYGLLFADASMQTGKLQMGDFLKEVRENTEYITDPDKGSAISPGKDILGIKLTGSAVTGYVLASDAKGMAFRRQVCEMMTSRLGLTAIRAIGAHTEDEKSRIDAAKTQRSDITEESAAEQYLRDEQSGSLDKPPAPESMPPEVKSGKKNPIEVVRNLRRYGNLYVVEPDLSGISNETIDLSQVYSGRSHESGMCMAPTPWNKGVENLCIGEFLAEDFPCYTNPMDEKGLKYQVEYAIGHKASDAQNLKAVIDRIIAVREFMNVLQIYSDDEKRQEAERVGKELAQIIEQGETAPAFSFAVMLAWAYGESICDCKVLLEGGKVSLWKSKEEWQMPLGGLIMLEQVAEYVHRGSDQGMNYEEYLRMLLFTESTEKLTNGAMDLVEMNMRNVENAGNFRLDCCIDAVEVELNAGIDKNVYTIRRSYGYDMK